MMAKVLIFNNFYRTGSASIHSVLRKSGKHEYDICGPGTFRANPYAKKKHITFLDFLKRLMATTRLAIRSITYDVLIVDSAISAALVSCWLWVFPWPKLATSTFNLPRRRNGAWRILWKFLFKRVAIFVVHSKHDICIAAELLDLPESRFVFSPFRREIPRIGEFDPDELEYPSAPYIISLGGNARDYTTLCEAVRELDLHLVIVAPEYRLAALSIPENVTVYSSIPLQACDKMVADSKFTIFTFDGSEPSCGQISVVTSFMLGKPTICTDLPGMYDYVGDEINGLYVPIFDPTALRNAIQRLYDDSGLYHRLSEGALEWAQHHATSDAHCSDMDRLVDRLMDGDYAPAK